MLEQRRRLVQRGIRVRRLDNKAIFRTILLTSWIYLHPQADRLQPEWCRQNSGQCYVGANNPHGPPPEATTAEPEPVSEAEKDDGGADSARVAATALVASLTMAVLLR